MKNSRLYYDPLYKVWTGVLCPVSVLYPFVVYHISHRGSLFILIEVLHIYSTYNLYSLNVQIYTQGFYRLIYKRL